MKKLSKKMLTGLVLGSLMACGTAFAAEEAAPEFELDQIIVTAQRTETKDLDTPASVSIITAKDIENSGARTVGDVLEHQIGLTPNSYGQGGRDYGGSSSRVNMRGLDKGTLVLLNGTPLNMLNYNGSNVVPVEAIEKIEIVRGGQAALYGEEAAGGVINIITKNNGKPKTSISGGIGNFDKKWNITSIGEKYMVSYTKNFFGDVYPTNSDISNKRWSLRDSSQENAFLSITPVDKVTLTYSHMEGNYYRDYTKLINGIDTGDGASTNGVGGYYYKDRRDNISLAYDDKDNEFKSIVAFNSRKVDPYNEVLSKFKRSTRERASSSDWNLKSYIWDTQKGWDLRNGKDHLVVGFNLKHEKTEDRTQKKANKEYDADRTTEAIYASYKHSFSNDFSATIGFRGLHVSDEMKDQNAFLPQIQTLYKINEKTSWYTNVGKTFEMPALNQYYSSSAIAAKKLGDRDNIDAQQGWTYETGIKWIDEKASLKFDIFHMDIDGKFDWKTLPGGSTSADKYLVNDEKFKNTGVEIEYKQKIDDKFNYRLGLMFANPKNKSIPTKDIPNPKFEQQDAKFQLTTGVDYKIGKFTSELNYLFVGKRQNSYYDTNGTSSTDSNKAKGKYVGDRKLKNRSLLNMNLSYAADEHSKFTLTLNNILGSKDMINTYENYGMPYNWMLNYTYSF